MKNIRMLTLHALLALAAGAASAQADSRPDPLDPRARVPAVDHRSTLSTYRPYRDPALTNWRESNDQVGRLGGHVGHVGHTEAVRGSAGKTSAPAPKDAPGPRKPPPSGHGSHR